MRLSLSLNVLVFLHRTHSVTKMKNSFRKTLEVHLHKINSWPIVRLTSFTTESDSANLSRMRIKN